MCNGKFHISAYQVVNLTLALAVGWMSSLEVFCDAPPTMRRIVLKFCIAYGASFAQLLVKYFDRVMSGHGAMTLQEVQGQAIFLREIAEYDTFEGDIKASFDYFRSELT